MVTDLIKSTKRTISITLVMDLWLSSTFFSAVLCDYLECKTQLQSTLQGQAENREPHQVPPLNFRL